MKDEPEDGSPEDTFALVGNEVRTAIIQALGDARPRNGSRPVLSFSELRDRIPMGVRSSQFNYHLQQLVGQFVEDVDGGYRLRPAGTALYRSVRAETFDRDVELECVEVGIDCYFCGAAVTARYETGEFEMRCPDCAYRYFSSTRIPPSGVDDVEALLSRVHRHDRHKLFAFTRGVCPRCASDLERRFLGAEEAAFQNTDHDDVYVFHVCSHCGNQDYRSVGESLLFDPTISAFFADRGVDVTATPRWELPFAATDERLSVASTDPWRVEVRPRCAGDTLEVVVDETLEILSETVH